MATRVFAILLTLALATAALAEDENRPPMDIRAYPGAQTTMEVNMTNQDFLPMIQAMLPLAGDKLGKFAGNVKPEDLADILRDVKRIEFLQMELGKPKVTERAIADYYGKNLPSGTWSRVMYRAEDGKGITAVYAQDGMESIYWFRVRTEKVDGKPIKKIEVAKTEGKLDLGKLFSFVCEAFESSLSAGKQ